MGKDEFLQEVISGLGCAAKPVMVTFASRIALRMLPWLAVRLTQPDSRPFSFWWGSPEGYLLSLFRGLVLGQTGEIDLRVMLPLIRAIHKQAGEIKQGAAAKTLVFKNDAGESVGEADPPGIDNDATIIDLNTHHAVGRSTASDAAAYDAAYAAAACNAVCAAVDAVYAANAYEATAATCDAVYAAADAAYIVAEATAYAAVGTVIIPAILQDIIVVKIKPSEKMHLLPLFSFGGKTDAKTTTAYQGWQRAWLRLQQQMLAVHPDFDLWIYWLNDRYAGKPWDSREGLSWIDYPPEIEAGGVSEIKAYILSRLSQKASKPLNQIRAIFIGYGNTGKTSIIRCLHDEPVNKEEDMTPGVAIRESPLAGNGLTTLFWDFGGQVIAHATHQFFLRSSCVYVLVLTARDAKNLTDDAEYWLQHVRAFSSDAPVLVVGNKSEVQRVLLERKSLTDKYPNIVGFFDISCWHLDQPEYREQFDDFKQALCTQLRGMSLHQMMFTPEQFAVLNTIKQLAREKSLLPYAEFDHLCAQHNIATEGVQNRDWLMKTLDQLGVVIHFPQLPWVNDFVLNPRWLTWAVYTLMYGSQATIDVTAIKQALKAHQVHDETGKLLTFDDDKLRFIADAMVEFKLCYRMQSDEHRYVIPSLLAPELAADLQRNAWDKDVTLAYRMVFKSFVPRHLMPQLIVRRNQEIAENNVCQKAALLYHPKHQVYALLEVDYADRELFILLKGEQAREYLYELRLMIAEVLQNMRVERVEEVRLPEVSPLQHESMRRIHAWSDEWANIKRLENMRRHSETKYYSDQQVYELTNLVQMFFAQQQLADIAQA